MLCALRCYVQWGVTFSEVLGGASQVVGGETIGQWIVTGVGTRIGFIGLKSDAEGLLIRRTTDTV